MTETYEVDLSLEVIIRHINPLMFDVIDDKPEGVAQGVYTLSR